MSLSSGLTLVPSGLQRYPRNREYVNTPIANYAEMKAIFMSQFVCKTQLYQPNLLIRALNFLADNKEEYAEYRELQPSERRTWLRKQFPA
jgi:hypothetical protein